MRLTERKSSSALVVGPGLNTGEALVVALMELRGSEMSLLVTLDGGEGGEVGVFKPAGSFIGEGEVREGFGEPERSCGRLSALRYTQQGGRKKQRG